MSDALDGLPDTPPPVPPEAGGSLAELWRNLWPWDQLVAKGQPERWLKLGPDVLPVLASLVGSGGGSPQLLAVDATQRLLTTANPGTIQKLTANVAIGDTLLHIDNALPYPAGTQIMLATAPTNPAGHWDGPFKVLFSGNQALTILGEVDQVFLAGDYVIGVPPLTLEGEAPMDRHADSTAFSAPNVGVAASLALGGFPHLQSRLAYLTISFYNAVPGNGGVIVVHAWDGPSGGTELWVDYLSVPVTKFAVDHSPIQLPKIAASRGNVLTIDSSAPPAGTQIVISAGSWDQPQLR